MVSAMAAPNAPINTSLAEFKPKPKPEPRSSGAIVAALQDGRLRTVL